MCSRPRIIVCGIDALSQRVLPRLTLLSRIICGDANGGLIRGRDFDNR